MEHSGLKEHKFKKGKFISPWNSELKEYLKPKIWFLERLPEYMWIGLILEEYGRKVGLEKCYYIIKELNEINSDIKVPSISNILSMDTEKQKRLYVTINKQISRSTLAPLTLIYTYTDFPCFFKSFYDPGKYDEKLSRLNVVLKKANNHQSDFSTDMRFIIIYFMLMKKKVGMPKEILDRVLEYPRLEHNDSKMYLIRPTIRSLEIGLSVIEEVNRKYLEIFWGEISNMSDCENFYMQYENDANQSEIYKEYLKEIFNYLSDVFITTEPLNDKMLVLLGIATFSYKRIIELVDHNLYNSISGRNIVRSLIENYIMIKYLLANENKHENIWKEYQYYGIGLYKLVVSRERECKERRENSHVNYGYLEAIVNEYIDEEFIDMDTRYFNNQNIRLKAEEVDEKELYGLYYDYDSSFEHGLWGAIRESSLLKCNSPMHQYHCTLDVNNIQALPSVWNDCIYVMNKILLVIDTFINIPEELMKEVKRFEQ